MKHEATHPWISFRLELAKASPRLWLGLGEAKSKCQHLAGVPLEPQIAKKLHSIYLARGALATTAIEGNTLSEKEALKIVKGESKLPKSQQYLAKEIKNILTASNIIMSEIEKDGDRHITSEDIRRTNQIILNGLEVADYVTPGHYRECEIEVSTYIGPTWEEVAGLIDDLCVWLNGEAFSAINDEPLIRAIIKAVVAHVYVAWIHPFGDGNGRTSRMLEFRFLIEGGVPSPAAHLLSNHYNKTRTAYYRHLEESSKNGGNLLPFLEYAVEGFVDQLREQLLFVKFQQWHLAWRNYVEGILGSKKNPSTLRQIQLILALSQNIDTHARSEIPDLSPEIARLYARKTNKTLTRDLNKLKNLSLIEIRDGKVIAKTEMILSFLPRAKKGELRRQLEDYFIVKDKIEGAHPTHDRK